MLLVCTRNKFNRATISILSRHSACSSVWIFRDYIISSVVLLSTSETNCCETKYLYEEICLLITFFLPLLTYSSFLEERSSSALKPRCAAHTALPCLLSGVILAMPWDLQRPIKIYCLLGCILQEGSK